jgi:hypothetical protein
MAPGCNGDVLRDSAFKLWCGPTDNELCDWQVDQGNVGKTPTWNDHEFGVELIDVGTQISQISTEGSDCMEFSAVADVEAAADVIIGIDFDLDGQADYTSPVSETHWHVARTVIFGPSGYGKTVHVVVRKRGDGHAVLAEIRLQRVTTCTGARFEMKEVPIGGLCWANAQCASGICCGQQDDVNGGVVSLGACSQCCATKAPCSDGAACKPRTDMPIGTYGAPPQLCDPQDHHGKANDPCFDDQDCQSGCEGASVVKDSSCADAGPAGPCPAAEMHAGHCR